MYNILVCDDEKDIVSAIRIYLSSEGYQVFEAFNGTEAVEAVRREDMARLFSAMETLSEYYPSWEPPVSRLSANWKFLH